MELEAGEAQVLYPLDLVLAVAKEAFVELGSRSQIGDHHVGLIPGARREGVGLYTKLPLPIMYSVWHTQSQIGDHHVGLIPGARREGVGLCTIWPLPILYGVWHTQGGSGERRILRNRRAIVVQ